MNKLRMARLVRRLDRRPVPQWVLLATIVVLVIGFVAWALYRERDLPTSGTASPACRAALAAVTEAGLVLPPGYAFACPGDTDAGDGRSPAAGVTCGFPDGCPAGPGPYVAVDPARSAAAGLGLECVVAHEVAHALDYVELGDTTERSATARAEDAGYPARCQGQPPTGGAPHPATPTPTPAPAPASASRLPSQSCECPLG